MYITRDQRIDYGLIHAHRGITIHPPTSSRRTFISDPEDCKLTLSGSHLTRSTVRPSRTGAVPKIWSVRALERQCKFHPWPNLHLRKLADNMRPLSRIAPSTECSNPGPRNLYSLDRLYFRRCLALWARPKQWRISESLCLRTHTSCYEVRTLIDIGDSQTHLWGEEESLQLAVYCIYNNPGRCHRMKRVAQQGDYRLRRPGLRQRGYWFNGLSAEYTNVSTKCWLMVSKLLTASFPPFVSDVGNDSTKRWRRTRSWSVFGALL